MVIIFLTAGSLWYFITIRTNRQQKLSDNTDMKASADDKNHIVTAAGVTEIGMEPVTFAIGFLEDTSLYVEEVYLSDGQTVVAGEPVIRFTDDSIAKARAELERAVQNAELAYRSSVISNGEDKIQAKYSYDTAILEAEFAPQVYQDTLTQLEMQLAEAEEAFSEAQNEYNVYHLAVVNNTFYEDYQIEELKKAYDDAYDLLVRRSAYWDISPEEFDSLSGDSDRQWIIRTLTLLKEEMIEAQNEYEQARRDYQKEIEGAELKLQTLMNQAERAKQNLVDAQVACQKGCIHAKTVYELAVARGQLAESEYNVSLMELMQDLERLKAAWDDAVANKILFEDLIGDGYLYTEQAGTVLMIQADAGQILEGGSLILAYANTEKMSVSVTVPALDAARLAEGETAVVTVADCGSFDGIVEAVWPLTAPDNKASVYSMVIVSLDGYVRMILPDRTATVVFGEDAQDDIAQCAARGHTRSGRRNVSHMFEFNLLSDTDEEHAEYLEVAEVYVEAGQNVKEGAEVCRFTQESIDSVRKTLAGIQAEAGNALTRAQTDYHLGVLEAGLNHNEVMTDKVLAQTVYDNTIARLNSVPLEKILESERLLTEIFQMQQAITDDQHQQQRANLMAAYDKAKKQLENARESYVTSQIEAVQNFQDARTACETFFSQSESANQQIADKVGKVHALQDEILQSQQLLEKALMEAEQTRNSAEIAGEIANIQYAGILKEYEAAVRKAQSDLDQATRRLDEFNGFIGEGTIYADQGGLITAVGCRAGDRIADARKLVSLVAEENILIETGEKEDVQ